MGLALWHKFIDTLTSLFGLPKAYKEKYDALMAAHDRAVKHNAAASQMELIPLQEELVRLLDEYVADKGNYPAPVVAPSANGNPGAVTPAIVISPAAKATTAQAKQTLGQTLETRARRIGGASAAVA